jgi:hypothetical protein
MLTKGSGIQSQYFANQQVMVGKIDKDFMPYKCESKMIDSEYADATFIPGTTWVSENESGFIARGIIPNAKSIGLVVLGAGIESLGAGPSVYTYENRAIPVLTMGNCWINVVTAPSNLYKSGIAVNNTTGQATCYNATATAGIFTCGVNGATLAAWQAVTAGSFKITVDGGSQATVTGVNFSTVTSFDEVANVLEAAITGAYVTYDTAKNLFIFASKTTGASSTIALAADTTGTSIYTASYFNGAGGAATNGAAAGSVPTGYTALPSVKIEKWAAEVTTKVNVSFPVKALTV